MICDKCGVNRDDVLKRLFVGEVLIAAGFYDERIGPKGESVKHHIDPTLCTDCCAEMPGRGWMKRAS